MHFAAIFDCTRTGFPVEKVRDSEGISTTFKTRSCAIYKTSTLTDVFQDSMNILLQLLPTLITFCQSIYHETPVLKHDGNFNPPSMYSLNVYTHLLSWAKHLRIYLELYPLPYSVSVNRIGSVETVPMHSLDRAFAVRQYDRYYFGICHVIC